MARAHAVAASFLVLIGSALSVATTLTEKHSLVRRHADEKDVEQSARMEIMAKREIASLEERVNQEDLGELVPADVDSCNMEFPITSTSSPNDCTKGGTIAAEGLNTWAACKRAAERLGFTYKGETDNTYVAIPPYPVNCSVNNGDVYWNQYEQSHQLIPNNVSDLNGAVQICWRHKYVNGQNNTDSSDSSVCPTDYEIMATTGTGAGAAEGSDCRAAHNCMVGTAWCQTDNFRDQLSDHSANRPLGCFREPPGTSATGSTWDCTGFNAYTGTMATVAGKAICRISSSYNSTYYGTTLTNACGTGTCGTANTWKERWS